jgi:DNA-binding MarR family transcriptional regulator
MIKDPGTLLPAALSLSFLNDLPPMNPSKEQPLSQDDIGSLADIVMVMQRRFMASLMGELARGKVSFPQFFLLGHLCAQGGTGMSRIAELMNHSTPAATGLVQRLEKLGYVRRSHEADDRRKVTVAATPKGKRLVEGIRQEMIGNLEKVMGRLDPGDQNAWLDIYRKIHEYCTSCHR